MIEGKDVDFNGKNQNLVVYVFCHLQLGVSCAFYLGEVMKKIIGREWPFTLKFQMVQTSVGESESGVEKTVVEKKVETTVFSNHFPKFFPRKQKRKTGQIMKENAKVKQHKERKIHNQMQKTVDAEMKRLMKDR